MQVDAIEQGAGDTALVIGAAAGRAAAAQRGIVEVAAAARSLGYTSNTKTRNMEMVQMSWTGSAGT
jgi:hypothetical protein